MFNKKWLNYFIIILLLGFFVLFFQVNSVYSVTPICQEKGTYYTCELPPPAEAPGKCGGQGQTCIGKLDCEDQAPGLQCCICKMHLSGGDSLVGNLSSGCRETGTCELNDFMRIATFIAKWILGITGSLALLFFIYGGVMFLISGGSSERVTKAKQIIIGAVIGLIIVFVSWMIINFIMTSLGYSFGNWFEINGVK